MTLTSLFFTVLATIFVAEMGDKTQLLLIAMTSKYKLRDIILGTAVATVVLNAVAVLAGGLLNEFLKTNLWAVKLVASLAFFYFSLTSIKADDDDEESHSASFGFAPLAVFTSFFLAELGDKTQLASITFGATTGLNIGVIVILLASSIGLLSADVIGLAVGHFLHGKTPDSFFKLLAFGIFAAFGFLSLNQGIVMLNEAKQAAFSVKLCISAAALIFAIIAGLMFFAQKKRKKNIDNI